MLPSEKPLVDAGIGDLGSMTPFPRIIPLKRGKGETFPWDDPAFSERMLAEHLDQSHSQASRARSEIQTQVGFLTDNGWLKPGMTVLDLGCGPGLYAEAMYQSMEVAYVGIDLSPASVQYATKLLELKPRCRFVLDDIRDCAFPAKSDLVLMVYDVFSFLSDEDADCVLGKINEILGPDGMVVIETISKAPSVKCSATWRFNDEGIFSSEPYLELIEEGPIDGGRYWGHRHVVVAPLTGKVHEYRNFRRVYHYWELHRKLKAVGLKIVESYSGFSYNAYNEKQSNERVVIGARRE